MFICIISFSGIVVNNNILEFNENESSRLVSKYRNYLDLKNSIFSDEYLNLYTRCNYYDFVNERVHDEIDKSCTSYTDSSSLKGFIWGDSHAQSVAHGIIKKIPEIEFIQVTASGCAPSILKRKQSSPVDRACDYSNEKAFEVVVRNNPKFIIFAQRIYHHVNEYESIIKKLRVRGVTSNIIILGPVPQWLPSLPLTVARRHMDKNDVKFFDFTFDDRVKVVDEEMKLKTFDTDVSYISLYSNLCDDEGCLAKVDENNTLLVWDYGHLTFEGSSYVVRNIIRPKVIQYLIAGQDYKKPK
ncbi:hypothetical protein L4D20_16935 [Vibrio kyushuensis]|uniref:SGNH hydrolase domain-containing protein n=1 Tax=Vibrio kyushuensis TaxID=2910249 RepID=UPI003D1358A2